MLPPLILHVVYRFDTGGLENGVVNLINHMNPGEFRHAVMALTEVTGFAQRIQRPDVQFISLRKPPGQGVWHYGAWRREIRRLQPRIVHTRNLGALEMQIPAWAAGVPVRIHGEHGRDMSDPQGMVRKYQWMRRAYSPFVHGYVALSQDLAHYLTGPVGLSPARVQTICNGVDTVRFAPPREGQTRPIEGCPFNPREHFLIGTVGRLQAEKDQHTLLRAFAELRRSGLGDAGSGPARLVLVGDGPERAALEQAVRDLGLSGLVWLAGDRQDVPAILQGLHLFVLPSRAEGISNTILEAMASGLAVVATRVGGNEELVLDGQTGALVPAHEPIAMARALGDLCKGDAARALGVAARLRAEQSFSLLGMVQRYEALYRDRLQRHAGAGRAARAAV